MAKLEFRELSVKFGERTLLDRITLSLEPGEFVALVGPHGAGKTTLLRAALALHAPDAGQVLLGDCPVGALGARSRAAAIGWLPQHIRSDEPVTALEAVAAARFRFDETPAASRRAAIQALARVNADDYAERAITRLSGGERQRVAFASLIAQEAEVLLFDEPGNHLDPAQQLEAYRILGALWREGRTLLCINHDVNLLHHVGDANRLRVVGLSAGRLAFDSRFADPDLPAHLASLFDIHVDTLWSNGQRFILPRPLSSQ